ncbi:lytic transglycosylase domain-containing protein [Odoribacter lunatus]|uniref:lytic transglycosylase domain-containing protein n=1 Tax=Odoribacter lunatus TaxID=2941335 RepID=UPI00203FF575|nr:lytic transglycosylase domain-containing protein [Odoribacter lunatus]
MKQPVTLLYLLFVLFVLNLTAFLFFSRTKISCQAQAKQEEVISLPETTTTDVVVPTGMSFAGEEVPLYRTDVQEALRKELIVNTYLHSHTIQLLKNAPRMFAIIEPILKKAGIPDDFKYLAVIESTLNPSAVSPAKAVGLWQFMEGTGKEYGLEINREVDERYHVRKSTEAATRYLQKAYDRFGSWTLAAASYNAGCNMLQTQMTIQKEADYYNLLLGEETERYVFRILALKQIMSHPELYHFENVTPYPTEEIKTVKVSGPVNEWTEFAKKHHISYKTLKRFNPWLRKSDLLNPKHKTYEVAIPVHTERYR